MIKTKTDELRNAVRFLLLEDRPCPTGSCRKFMVDGHLINDAFANYNSALAVIEGAIDRHQLDPHFSMHLLQLIYPIAHNQLSADVFEPLDESWTGETIVLPDGHPRRVVRSITVVVANNHGTEGRFMTPVAPPPTIAATAAA